MTAYNLAASKAAASDLLDSNDSNLKRKCDGLEINFNAKLPKGVRLFGGTSTERTLSNSCSAAANNRTCSPSATRARLVFRSPPRSSSPAPTRCRSRHHLQRLAQGAGRCAPRRRRPALRCVHRRHGLDRRATRLVNGRSTYLNVTPTTNWTAATCLDSSKCTVGARIIPNMTQAGLTIPLVAAQTEYAPRLTQVDLSFGKELRSAA